MKERVLIIRSSALGDVAMTIPVIYPLVEVYKEVEFYFLSLPKHKSLLLDAPANLHFIPMDKNGKHKGIKGLWRLYKELRGMNFSYVADLHGLIRSWALDMLLKCSSSCKVAIINKGREEKSRLIGHSNGVLYPLESTFQRYKEVFSKLGFETGEVFTPFCLEKENHEGSYWIGIAPFAKHLGKCYPVERVEEVVKMLSSYPTIKIFLFGGGEKEKSICEEWEKKYPHTYSTIGEGDLRADMKRLGEIDILLSMDSANMHIASL
ncbi:MAG TPA: glycosyl transferase family 1, partial [Porphyromonadaceae bacterium]|nr:glycosyl transferase family 1 [Porphyromonadaceae bacterium]